MDEQTTGLPYDDGKQIDLLCDRFLRAWREGPDRPKLIDYLEGVQGPSTKKLFRQLLDLEITLLAGAGEQPTPSDYIAEFPEHQATIDSVFARVDSTIVNHRPTDDSQLSNDHSKSDVIGKYHRIKELGRGGQAVTYLAIDPDLNRKVVVKEYHSCEGLAERDAVLNEGRALARVRSNYVARCLTVEREGDRVYLVMEYIRGKDLFDYARQHNLSHQSAADLVACVAEGLYDVHLCGLIHRDVKPANILISRDESPRLVDFGLAAFAASDDLDEFGGTIQFMSPEQANLDSESIDQRTDIFGAGAVLYWLLTGQQPYQGDDRISIWDRAKDGKFTRPRDINSDIPEDLEQICLQAMAFKPEDRFSSADELARALRSCFGPSAKTAPTESTVAIESHSPEKHEATEPAPNPYKGLSAFSESDADVYFGREPLIEEALDRIRNSVATETVPGFLAIIGASGSGKSSLAFAGVLANIKSNAVAGSENWPVVQCRPGNDALEGLAIALAAHPHLKEACGDLGDLIDRLGSEDRRLHLISRLALQGRPERDRVLILVDQFEELFRPGEADVKEAFIGNLLHAAYQSDGRTVVMITMRADFYAKASVYSDLADALSHNQILVGPMTEQQLAEAIRKPAELRGVGFEPGLVEMLVQDMRTEAGALPFLQDSLTQLWEKQSDSRLTVADYKSIGRVDGAIEYRANQLFETFDDKEREVCRQIFLRLTQPGEGTEDTKRRVRRAELGDSDEVDRMIQRLAAERLITTEGEAGRGDNEDEVAYVEVSHEALIRAWGRLRTWIDQDRDSLRVQHQITVDAAVWEKNPDEAFLYRGTRLGLVEDWLKDHADVLTRNESDFLQASHELRGREEHERAAAAARLRRWAWTAAGAAVIATGLAIIASLLALGFNKARQDELAQKNLADQRASEANRARQDELTQRTRADQRAREALHQAKIVEAQRIATEAEDLFDEDPGSSAKRALLAVNTLYSSTEMPLSSKDRRYPLKVLESALTELERREKTLVLGNRPSLMEPTLSTGGRWLLCQTYDRNVFLWDLQDEDSPARPILGPKGAIVSAVFSNDERWLVAHSAGGQVRLWPLGEAKADPIDLTKHTGEGLDLSFDASSRWLLTADKEIGRVWYLGENPVGVTPTRVLRGFDNNFLMATFAGPWLLFDGGQGIDVWNLDRLDNAVDPFHVADMTLRATRRSSLNLVYYGLPTASTQQQHNDRAQVSSDGTWVVTRSKQNDDLRLLDLSQGKETPSLLDLPKTASRPSNGPVPTFLRRIEFNASGSRLMASLDRSILIWTLAHDQEIQPPAVIPSNSLLVGRFLHDDWIAAGSRSSTVVFQLSESRPKLTLRLNNTKFVFVSPDGRWLVASKDLVNPPTVHDLKTDPNTHKFELFADISANRLVFTKDGAWMSTAKERSVIIWNLGQDNPFHSMMVLPQAGVDTSVRSVLVSNDNSRLLVVGDWSSRLYKPDPKGGGWVPSSVLEGFREGSNDGDRPTALEHGWVMSFEDGKAIVRQTGDSHLVREISSPDAEVTHGALISPQVAVIANAHGRIELWNLEKGQVQRQLATDIGAVSVLEVSPSGQWLAASTVDGQIRIWNLIGEGAAVEAQVVHAHETAVFGMAIDPDSKWLAAKSYDGLTTLRRLDRPHESKTWLDESNVDYIRTNSYVQRVQADREDADKAQQDLVTADDWTTGIWNARLRYARPTRERTSRSQQRLFGNAPLSTAVREKTAPTSALGQPAFLRDGRSVRAGWSSRDDRIVFGGSLGLGILDLASQTEELLLPFGKDPTWSPNPELPWIAFVGGTDASGGETLWIARPDGSEARYLDDGGFPSWAKDGRLFYRTGAPGAFGLRSVDLSDKTSPPRDYHFGLAHHYPAVSPDGRWVAHQMADMLASNLVITDLEHDSEVFRWPIYGSHGLLLSWSPDSRFVTFGTYAAEREAIGIWALDVERRTARQIVEGPYTRAAWSRDGKRICFDIRLDTYQQLWSVDASTINKLPEHSNRQFLAKLFDDYDEQMSRNRLTPDTRIQVELAYGLWQNGFPNRGLKALTMIRDYIKKREQPAPAIDARYYALLSSVLPKVSVGHEFPNAAECKAAGIEALRQAYESGELSLGIARRDPILRLLIDDTAYASLKAEYETAKSIVDHALRRHWELTLLARGETVRLDHKGTIVLKRSRVRRTHVVNAAAKLPLLIGDSLVTGIDASGDKVFNQRAEQLAKLWSLEVLNLSGCKLTDQVIEAIRQLPNLRELRLVETDLTDNQLRRLEDNLLIDTLDLQGTPITDASISSLLKLENLAILNISDTSITAAGLKRLSGLSGIRHLSCQNLPLDADALNSLAQCKSLIQVSFGGEEATEELLRQFREDVNDRRGDHLALEITTPFQARQQIVPVRFSSPSLLSKVIGSGRSSPILRPFEPGSSRKDQRNNFAGLRVGKKELLGVPFVLAESILSASTPVSTRTARNQRKSGVAVNRAVQQLSFLHGAESKPDVEIVPDGTSLGAYEVEYDDGEKIRIPLLMGQNIRLWWDYPDSAQSTRACTDARVAWRAFNEYSRNWSKDRPSATTRIYIFRWQNPKPTKRIRLISLVAAGVDSAGVPLRQPGFDDPTQDALPTPFCLAISAEIYEPTAQD